MRADRYAMYYRHEPGRAVRALSSPGALALARAGFRAANLVGAPLGNKLTVQAVRAQATDGTATGARSRVSSS